MNWDTIGAVSEVVGAIAVVVSIIYLAVQISSNTKTMRANAGFEATHSWANSNEIFSQFSDDHLMTIVRTFDSTASWDDFSEVERVRISLSFRALFQKLEGQYYLYRYKTLDEGIWKNRAMFSAGLLRKPFFAAWWEIEKDQRVYSPEFIEALEATQPIEVKASVLGGNDGAA